MEPGRLLRRCRHEKTPGSKATLLSMTNEEQDFPTFQAYLHDLSPDALWDVYIHLDADQYPRRYEAVEREMTRRRLFYVSPYSTLEARLRALFLSAFLLSLCAFVLHILPGVSGAMNHAASSLSGAPVVQIAPGQTMPLFAWQAGDARACAGLLRVTRFGATAASVLATVGALYGLPLAFRHRLRHDVLLYGIVAVAASWLLLRVSG